MINNLNIYDYEDFNYMVSVVAMNSGKQNIVIVDDSGELLAQMGLKLENNYLKLFDEKSETVYADVELPNSIISIAETGYTDDKKGIIITVNNSDGTTSEIELDITDLIVVYKAGQGIDIDEENTISVKVKKVNDGEAQILSVGDEGLILDVSTITDKIDELSSDLSGVTEHLTEVEDSIPTKISDLENDSEFVLSDELATFSSETLNELTKKVDEGVCLTIDDFNEYSGNVYSKEEVENLFNESEENLKTWVDDEYSTKDELNTLSGDVLDAISELDSEVDNLVSALSGDVTSLFETFSGSIDTAIIESLKDKVNLSDFEELSDGVDNLKSELSGITSSIDEVEGRLDNLDVKYDNLTETLEAKQDTLVSGTNIKKINGEDILGEGNIITQNLTAGNFITISGGVISVDGLENFDSSDLEESFAEQFIGLRESISAKANASDVYTKNEIDTQHNELVNDINSRAFASNVYPKSETYSNTEADNAISTAITSALQSYYDSDAIDDKLNKINGDIENAVDTITSEVSQSANDYTDKKTSAFSENITELARKITILTNGNYTDSGYNPSNGSGLFDELYKLVHSLIDGMDEGNLTPIATSLKNIEDRLTALENKD